MCDYKWKNGDAICRIKAVDIRAYVDDDYFDCREFRVEFFFLADMKDFLQVLNANNYHSIQSSGREVYLKPKCGVTCRKTIALLQAYDFMPQTIREAYGALYLLPGTHWFANNQRFPMTKPY